MTIPVGFRDAEAPFKYVRRHIRGAVSGLILALALRPDKPADIQVDRLRVTLRKGLIEKFVAEGLKVDTFWDQFIDDELDAIFNPAIAFHKQLPELMEDTA